MIPVENIMEWRGQEVVDPSGDKLGKLEEVYFDGESDEGQVEVAWRENGPADQCDRLLALDDGARRHALSS